MSRKLPQDENANVIQAPIWDFPNGQKIAIGVASAASAVINANVILVIADTDCFITSGAAPVAADAAGSFRRPRDHELVLGWNPGEKIAVIRDLTDGDLYVVPAK